MTSDYDLLSKLIEDVSFEKDFYESIAKSKNYEVISIDAKSQESLYAIDEIERKALELECESSGIPVLYRISYGNYAVVVCKGDSDKMGVVPENHSDGWEC